MGTGQYDDVSVPGVYGGKLANSTSIALYTRRAPRQGTDNLVQVTGLVLLVPPPYLKTQLSNTATHTGVEFYFKVSEESIPCTCIS